MSDTEFLPQKNNYLIGHTEEENTFLQAWKNNAMHHAWILSGAEGIGKATLAYRIARFLLWADPSKREQYKSLDVPVFSSTFQQVSKGSHPDLKVLQRDFIETDRKKIISAIQKGEALDDDDLSNLKRSAYIRVDDVRQINTFLSKTSFNEGWRIVIIDSVDDLNQNASNALLKILEEPPVKTLLLLISHNMVKLMPTIRSRCAKLTMKALTDTDVASLIRRYRPQVNEQKVQRLVNLSGGSIGRALLYADTDADEIYATLSSLLSAPNSASTTQIIDFSAQMAADSDKFDILQELLIKFLKQRLPSSHDPENLSRYWEIINDMFSDCRYINMDKKLMLINLLSDISRVL